MSKGTARISVRLDKTLHKAIGDYLKARQKLPGGVQPWTFTSFILQAITDKLNHLERSRKSGIKWKLTRSDEQLAAKLIAVQPSPLLEGEDITEAEADVNAMPLPTNSDGKTFDEWLDDQKEKC